MSAATAGLQSDWTAPQLLRSYSKRRRKRSAKVKLFKMQLRGLLKLSSTAALRLQPEYTHANRGECKRKSRKHLYQHDSAQSAFRKKVKRTLPNREMCYKSRHPKQTQRAHQNIETSSKSRTCMLMYTAQSTQDSDIMQNYLYCL